MRHGNGRVDTPPDPLTFHYVVKIFAYGSNMCSPRLLARVPSAHPLGPAVLAGHTLRFHKRGWRDGSGKADAATCNDPGARVWGVLFEIDPAHKPDLDRAEGLGHGYRDVPVRVTDRHGRSHAARMYQADPSAVDADAVPFEWYRDLVLAGALEHGLPDDYVARHIAACPACVDPDRHRANGHRALIHA